MRGLQGRLRGRVCNRWPLCWRKARFRQALVNGQWVIAPYCDKHRDRIHRTRRY